ncbi:uncharacterized protein [Prorops nasuta]|uniref:uncharacterized protein n=1 Tax=Prorops nasuta TaxID=863751 RepID=UPI0034CF3524
MHLVCLGVTKKLMMLWIKESNGFKLQSVEVKNLSNALMLLSQYVPREFARKPRNLEEIARFKATKFRLFLLYLSCAVIHKFLPKSNLMHFYTLHAAIFILSHPTKCQELNKYAEELLKYFVTWFGQLYGRQNLSFNIHNLIHLPKDVELYGCLDTFSSFPFENFLSSLKNRVKKNAKPLQQLHNRLTEISNQVTENCKNDVKYPVLIKPASHATLPFGYNNAYQGLQFKNFCLLSSKKADQHCYLRNGKIIQIQFFTCKENRIFVFGKTLQNMESLPDYPMNSKNLNIFVGNIWIEHESFQYDEIVSKAVRLPYTEEKYCFIPLLHTF